MTGVKQLKTNGSIITRREARTPEDEINEEEFFNSHVVHTNNNT